MNKDNKKFIIETLFLKEALKYNLTLKTEYVQTSEYEVGTIIKQNRPKGSEIISGYTLTITIAEEVDTSVDEEG